MPARLASFASAELGADVGVSVLNAVSAEALDVVFTRMPELTFLRHSAAVVQAWNVGQSGGVDICVPRAAPGAHSAQGRVGAPKQSERGQHDSS